MLKKGFIMYSVVIVEIPFGKNYFTKVAILTEKYDETLKGTKDEKSIIMKAISDDLKRFGKDVEFKIVKTISHYK